LFALTTVVLVAAFAARARAQAGSLPLGNPGVVVGNQITCPSAFYSNPAIPAVCHIANLSGCLGADNLNFKYSYDSPGSPLGTIVFFSGHGGTTPDTTENDFAGDYFKAGYEIVQLAWEDDWEDVDVPLADTGGTWLAATSRTSRRRHADRLPS
jgi:hypothetical protein